ncbi:MAG TPA: hypothetical protein VLT58_13170, partial [Polyangia bacterium]|nr:hypothetical protein [Polyangia bacterium]
SNPDGTPIFKTATVKNKAPQVAIDISHPSTDTLGITSCVLQGISIPESASAEGVKVIKIKAIESRATGKTVTKTAKGSSNNVALAKELRPKALADVPNKPSTERADLGPKGPRPKPGSGSN